MIWLTSIFPPVKIPPWWGFDSNDNSWGFVTGGFPPLNIYIHDIMMSHYSQIVQLIPRKITYYESLWPDDTSRCVSHCKGIFLDHSVGQTPWCLMFPIHPKPKVKWRGICSQRCIFAQNARSHLIKLEIWLVTWQPTSKKRISPVSNAIGHLVKLEILKGICSSQGCIIRSILPSGMGACGVSLEHVEDMEIFSCSPT